MEHGFTNKVVGLFLRSNLPLILLILSIAIGVAAVTVTPREEEPQIVVPMADVFVHFPGRSAAEVEQLVATPLERLLYQIDGVEYVYSMSRQDQAVITVRYYVGEDRERSLVRLKKKIDESLDLVPPGVTGWIVKPVEIDDVPIVTLTLTCADGDAYLLRRVAEEVVERLAAVRDTSRAYVVGGLPRQVHVYLDRDRLEAYRLSPSDVERAIGAANVTQTAGDFTRGNQVVTVETGRAFASAEELRRLVLGVAADQPIFLKDVAQVIDGPSEVTTYVRHGWGPARQQESRPDAPGSLIPPSRSASAIQNPESEIQDPDLPSQTAVTIAIAKKKGTNAVAVARDVLAAARDLKGAVIPDNIDLVVTRNAGLNADDKVNDLIEALAVALILAIIVQTLGLGWKEALIVAVAVPVVFGLTLAVNLLFGLTINRVTLFALILSLGLLVDDPIVDVENIVRHFRLRARATRSIVMQAVAEIRPPLIMATLAVIVSFLPLFFITGMMGPYMRPMALNVPVAMLMSMVVAFTITPWLSYHVLRRRYNRNRPDPSPAAGGGEAANRPRQPAPNEDADDPHGLSRAQESWVYRLLNPLLRPLLLRRWAGLTFLGVMAALLLLAVLLAATRRVPLKMLPYGNKNDFQLVIDRDEGTPLEVTDAAVRDFESYLRTVPEVVDFTSYVGLAAPMDFNGMVRHFYLRGAPNVADVQVNIVDRKSRAQQAHALVLRLRRDLARIAERHDVRLRIVEPPPGPPVLATVVAEVYGEPSHAYGDLVAAAGTVARRLEAEPGLVDVDTTIEAAPKKMTFVADKEKAALNGVVTRDLASTVSTALGGRDAGALQLPDERNPLRIVLRLPRAARSSIPDLSRLTVKGAGGQTVPLSELGRWHEATVPQTIYHKNLRRVVYVFGEMAGRPPADAVVDVMADRVAGGRESEIQNPKSEIENPSGGWVAQDPPKPVAGRTFFANGSGVAWAVPSGIQVDFAGEGEWKMTLDVFRDMGLAFAAALVAIYILLVVQTRSFVIPVVVMMAIPLTVIGIMPGFYLLNALTGGVVGGFADPTFFTATAMIGMIALAGIVTRGSIIIVDFIHLSLARGHSLCDAIVNTCAVRTRPILLTAGTAMLSALPIATDPIFSGLAWSLIFGLLASTVFTLFVVPVVYYLLYANKPGHGMGAAHEDD
jgi:multidrug efflux pump subunit AcrB